MEKQIFKVGDKVYDFYYGWGTITAKREDFENTDYIWVVAFENGYIEDYTIEGKYEITDKFRNHNPPLVLVKLITHNHLLYI